ncbi:MAG: hypothetical protein JNL97_05425 [Verrucomicrobiales bacterium]|nr:hypothetical protein [Verrucomicrobiales bacterium]
MKRCANCGSIIVFGPVRAGAHSFCNERCRDVGLVLIQAETLPRDVVEAYAKSIHAGACPTCHGPGPVDAHMRFTVSSFLVMTSWNSEARVACRACGRRAQVQAILLSLLTGWWGLPWGLILTPLQIFRNCRAIARPPDASAPSKHLKRLAAVNLLQYRQASPVPTEAGPGSASHAPRA